MQVVSGCGTHWLWGWVGVSLGTRGRRPGGPWGPGSEDERAEGAGQNPASGCQKAPTFSLWCCCDGCGICISSVHVCRKLPGLLLGDRQEPGTI